MGRLGGEAAEGGRRVEGAVPRAVRVTHSGVVERYVSMLKRMRTEYSAASLLFQHLFDIYTFHTLLRHTELCLSMKNVANRGGIFCG